jgi:hypothetical protein
MSSRSVIGFLVLSRSITILETFRPVVQSHSAAARDRNAILTPVVTRFDFAK